MVALSPIQASGDAYPSRFFHALSPTRPMPSKSSVEPGSGTLPPATVRSCMIRYDPEIWRYAISAEPREIPRNAPSLNPPGVRIGA